MDAELPGWSVALINSVGLPLMQIGLAWGFTRLPIAWFQHDASSSGRGRWRFVGKWKYLVPDGAGWFTGGFRKKRLESRDPTYLRRFVAETRRGEACHWCAAACCAFFLPINPWWGDLVIVCYAVVANFPCIAIQRYNRARLLLLLERQSRAEARSARS